jgi:hypothetical protein
MTIDPKIEKLSEVLLENIENVSETGVVQFKKDTFEKTLDGSELTMDSVKSVHEHRDDVIAATGLALGKKGQELFKKKQSPDQVTGTFKAHKDTVNGTFYKERNLPNNKGEIVKKRNVLSMGYVANGKEGTKGQLKAVKKSLLEDSKNL